MSSSAAAGTTTGDRPGGEGRRGKEPESTDVLSSSTTASTTRASSQSGDGSAPTHSLLSDRAYGSAPLGRPSIPRVKILTFRGNNVSQFLQKYELEFKSRGHSGESMTSNLPLYVKPSYFKMIKEMPGYAELIGQERAIK